MKGFNTLTENAVSLTIMNLNKQGKLFGYGLKPVYAICKKGEENKGGKHLLKWKKIKNKPIYTGITDGGQVQFQLDFA